MSVLLRGPTGTDLAARFGTRHLFTIVPIVMMHFIEFVLSISRSNFIKLSSNSFSFMLTLGLLDMDATLLDGAVRCTMGFLALAVEGIDMLAAAEGIIVAGFMLVAEGMLMLAAGFMLAAAEGIIVEGIDMLDAGFMYSFSCCLGANMVNRKK